MADRAKLFRNGGSQSVRLPKGYRFEGQDEVLISRDGRRVILEPCSPAWSASFLELEGAARDFPYPADPPPAEPARRAVPSPAAPVKLPTGGSGGLQPGVTLDSNAALLELIDREP